MTRAAPARLLGLADRGHLGPGAVADVAVYADDADRAKMFRAASLVFKDGELVVRDGEVTHYRWGRALTAAPGHDAGDRAPHAGLLRRALRPVGRRDSGCRQPRSGRPILSSRCHARDDRQRASASTTPSPRPSACARPAMSSPPTMRWARQAARHHDRLRHLGDRLRLRGRHRLRAEPAARRRTAARRARAAVRGLDQRVAEAVAEPGRPMRAHRARHGLLCGPRGRGGAQARRGAALFRRRLADLQALRRQATTGAFR